MRATLHLIGHFHSRTQRSSTQTLVRVCIRPRKGHIRGDCVFVYVSVCVCIRTRYTVRHVVGGGDDDDDCGQRTY